MDLEFFEFTPANSKEWDRFVLSSPWGSIHQISSWKTLQEQIPGREKVLGFGVKLKGNIKAVTLCVRMNTGKEKFWWYSPRGPVFDPEKDLSSGQFLITEVAKKLKNQGGIFWRLDPYLSPREGKKVYTGGIHSLKFQPATQNYQPTDTLEIDLQQSDEEILADMKRKGRYNINLARKKGITVQAIEQGKSTDKDLDDFWRLNTETTTRDHFSGHEKSYYHHFLKTLKNYAVLFFAEYKGKRIASAISTFCGDKAIYYFGASSSDPEFRPLMAPYLLQWEMMQYAKKKGCKTYDFLGIAPENDTDHPYAGISEFKWKFGGQRRIYALGREIIFQKGWYLMYRFAKALKT